MLGWKYHLTVCLKEVVKKSFSFRSLESCAYSASTLKEILNKIQKAVDDLSLRQYSNLHAWVGKLDETVEAKLSMRLQVSQNLE